MENAQICRSTLMSAILLIITVIAKANEHEGCRASLHHIDVGKSLPEKLSAAAARSKQRIEALQSGLRVANLRGRQLDDVRTSLWQSASAIDYYVELQLGTPAKKFTAIMDTGSHLIWVKCSPCKSCSKEGNSCNSCPATVLDPSQSSSYASLGCDAQACGSLPNSVSNCSASSTCGYTYAYLDGSNNEGEYGTEKLSLVSTSATTLQFDVYLGCAHTIGGSFGGADGLVGFAIGSTSLISQIPSFNGKFSYCLTNYGEDLPSPFFLGSSSSLSDPSLSSTPILSSKVGLYYVNLLSISVGSKTISRTDSSPLNSAGTIFDSGTSLTYLETSVFDAVKEEYISAMTGYTAVSYAGFDLCFDVSGATGNIVVPKIKLQFDGASMEPPLSNYLEFANAARSIICLLMAPSSQGIGIVGNLFQQNYHVAHDTTQMILSFAPTNCSTI